MLFLATEVYPRVEINDHPERFAEADACVEGLRRRSEERMQERWRIVESNIAGSPYCVPSGFSATDLYITKLGVWLDEAWRRSQLPRVEAVIAAVRAGPSLAHVWARHIR